MSTHTLQLDDLSTDLHGFAKQCYRFGSLDNASTQRALCLIANEQNGVFRLPQVVFQVVFNSSGFAHTTGGQNDFRAFVRVDCFGSIACHCRNQSGNANGVNAAANICQCFLIETAFLISHENFSCFNGKRAVHVNREIAEFRQYVFIFDLLEIVQ